MRAWNRLRSLLKSDRGNVLVIGAAALPLLMGSTGFAIDTLQLAFWKRQMQRAADSASLAGVHAIVQGGASGQAIANDLDEHIDTDLSHNETPQISPADIVHGSFANGRVVAGSTCGSRGAFTGPCYDKAVQVTLTSERRLPFMSLFTGASSTIKATATSAIIESGRFCLVSLYDGTDPGIRSSGNVTLDLGCGIVTNSRSEDAVLINGGSGDITASPISAVGGIDADSFTDDTVTMPYSPMFRDPYAGLPDPVLPQPCGGALTVNDNMTIEAGDPNCFSSVTVKNGATLTIKSDKFFVNDGTLTIKGTVKSEGNGTTLIMMGDHSDLTTNGGGKLQLTAPNSGPYQGIALFRERGAANPGNQGIHLTGGTDVVLNGAVYAPSTDITLGGNGAMGAVCVQIVGRKLWFHGNPELVNDCNDPTDGFRTRAVRLVS